MEAAQFWNRVAERYARSPIADPEAYEATLRRARAHLKTTDNALELGCGTGTTAMRLADAVNHYTASDCASAMLEIGREKARDAGAANLDFELSQIDARNPEFGRFDVVLAFNVLHLLPNLPGTLRQISAALPPGGRFISKTPCWPESAVPLKYRALSTLLPLMRLLGKAPRHVNLRPVGELETLFRVVGFELIEVGDYPAHPPSHFIVAQKPVAH